MGGGSGWISITIEVIHGWSKAVIEGRSAGPRVEVFRVPRETTNERPSAEKLLRDARRLVVKVGTNTVTGAEGDLCSERVEPIVRSIASLMKGGADRSCWCPLERWDWEEAGWDCIGRGWKTGHEASLRRGGAKPADGRLQEALFELGCESRSSIADRGRLHELGTVLEPAAHRGQAAGFGVLPIVNENDTVSTAELESVRQGSRTPIFSDNDRLAGWL